jgi:hypothetical protein
VPERVHMNNEKEFRKEVLKMKMIDHLFIDKNDKQKIYTLRLCFTCTFEWIQI